MLDEHETRSIQKASQVCMVIWMAMCFSLLPYLIIGMVLPVGNDQPAEGLDLIEKVLSLFAAVCFIATIVVPKKLMASQWIPDKGGDRFATVLKRYRIALIVSLALGEAVGLFGLVLYVMGSEKMVLYVFLSVAGIALLRLRPSEKALVEYVESSKKEVR